MCFAQLYYRLLKRVINVDVITSIESSISNYEGLFTLWCELHSYTPDNNSITSMIPPPIVTPWTTRLPDEQHSSNLELKDDIEMHKEGSIAHRLHLLQAKIIEVAILYQCVKSYTSRLIVSSNYEDKRMTTQVQSAVRRVMSAVGRIPFADIVLNLKHVYRRSFLDVSNEDNIVVNQRQLEVYIECVRILTEAILLLEEIVCGSENVLKTLTELDWKSVANVLPIIDKGIVQLEKFRAWFKKDKLIGSNDIKPQSIYEWLLGSNGIDDITYNESVQEVKACKDALIANIDAWCECTKNCQRQSFPDYFKWLRDTTSSPTPPWRSLFA